jgi:hypothetical protein
VTVTEVGNEKTMNQKVKEDDPMGGKVEEDVLTGPVTWPVTGPVTGKVEEDVLTGPVTGLVTGLVTGKVEEDGLENGLEDGEPMTGPVFVFYFYYFYYFYF